MHWIRAYATPLATGAGLVVGVTGLMMFFHLAEGAVKELHEWLGVVAVAAVLLHVVRNWPALLAYHRRGWALWGALAGAGCVTAGFVLASLVGGGEGGGGPGGMFRRLEGATLTELAPIFDTTPDALVTRLSADGLQGVAPDATVAAIAEASHTEPREVLGRLSAQ